MIKIFSRRHPTTAMEVRLSTAVRRRIWYLFLDCDPYYNPTGFSNWTLTQDALPEQLLREHGWPELRAYNSPSEWETVNIHDFILKGAAKFVLDATELFYNLLLEDKGSQQHRLRLLTKYQRGLNVIFDDANLPWRMLEGRIIQVDSKWLEEEIHSKTVELLSVNGFNGPLDEFQRARSDLSIGDYKGAINGANLALESTIKGILRVDKEKPGVLIRKLIDSGIVPEYHAGFLKAFEEHILRSVPVIRNSEGGVGHGQGTNINDPPKSLAELAVNLTGVLIQYLIKRYLELNPAQVEAISEEETEDQFEPPF